MGNLASPETYTIKKKLLLQDGALFEFFNRVSEKGILKDIDLPGQDPVEFKFLMDYLTQRFRCTTDLERLVSDHILSERLPCWLHHTTEEIFQATKTECAKWNVSDRGATSCVEAVFYIYKNTDESSILRTFCL